MSTVLSLNPVAYFPLDDPAGSLTARNLVNPALPGTLHGGITAGVAFNGGVKGMTFDGVAGSYISVPTDPALNINDTLSIMVWFKATVSIDSRMVARRNGGNSGNGYEAWAFAGAGGIKPAFNIYGNAGANNAFPFDNTDRATGTPQCFLGTCDESAPVNRNVYNNGVDVTLLAGAGAVDCLDVQGNVSLFIGSQTAALAPFTGTLAKIAIFNVKLTAGNAVTLFNAGTEIEPSGKRGRRRWLRSYAAQG